MEIEVSPHGQLDGQFKTFPKPYFIIPESLVASCAVIFARIVNKQTNELNYIL